VGFRSHFHFSAEKCDLVRAVLLGAGRMGITHFALFNLLTDFDIRWTVIEPSRALRLGMRRVLPASLLEDCATALSPGMGRFDIAVITSPTAHHNSGYLACSQIAEKIFIEKPLAVAEPTANVLCGYVMLHHPLQKHARALAQNVAPVRLDLTVRSNTVLSANTGWRGLLSGGGGVLSEFGSHLLSLLIDLGGPVDTIQLEEATIVHSVDAPDRARLTGRTRAGADFTLSLDWSDPEVRKPAWDIRMVLADGTSVVHDFYEITAGRDSFSIADHESASRVYLRGIEFTNQARHFLENDKFDVELGSALEIDRILRLLK
jgi:predicted dehydrogenase